MAKKRMNLWNYRLPNPSDKAADYARDRYERIQNKETEISSVPTPDPTPDPPLPVPLPEPKTKKDLRRKRVIMRNRARSASRRQIFQKGQARTKQTSICLSEEEHKALRKECMRRGVTFSELVRTACFSYLQIDPPARFLSAHRISLGEDEDE